MRTAAALAVLLPSLAVAQLGGNSCHRDDDCTLSTFAGCCGSCCPEPARAMATSELEARQQRCAVTECARPRCEAIECGALDPVAEKDKRAVCSGGHCVTESAPEPGCQVDSDCVMTTFGGCCGGCCPTPPHSVSAKQLQRQQAVCAVASCAAPRCGKVACPPRAVVEQVAVCRGGVCDMEAAHAECRADGDCELVPAPSSGCCQWQARARERPHIMDDTPGPPSPPQQGGAKTGDPRFGLSTGSGVPGCGVCPPMPMARAACRAARCVMQPLKR